MPREPQNSSAEAQKAKAEKTKRLSNALRENLKRRKAAPRKKKDGDDAGE